MKLIIFLLFALQIPPAQAGIFIEPFGGYHVTGQATQTGTANSKRSMQGLGYGGRLGYKLPFVFLGLEYHQVDYNTNFKDGPNGNLDVMEGGPSVMVYLPILFRFQASYYIFSQAKAETGHLYDSPARGFRAGIGYTGFPLVVFNFDYRSVEYTKVTYSDSSSSRPTGHLNTHSVFISMSIPLEL